MSGGGSNRVQETQGARDLAAIGAEQFEFYKAKLAPIENYVMQRTATMGTGAATNQVAGLGNVDAMTALQNEYGKVGLNPNSSGFNQAQQAMEQNTGSVVGNAQARGVLGAENQYLNSMGNLTSMGLGRGATAVQGVSDLATSNQSQIMKDAQTAFQQENINSSQAGILAGTGASVYANSYKPNSYGLRQQGVGNYIDNYYKPPGAADYQYNYNYKPTTD